MYHQTKQDTRKSRLLGTMYQQILRLAVPVFLSTASLQRRNARPRLRIPPDRLTATGHPSTKQSTACFPGPRLSPPLAGPGTPSTLQCPAIPSVRTGPPGSSTPRCQNQSTTPPTPTTPVSLLQRMVTMRARGAALEACPSTLSMRLPNRHEVGSPTQHPHFHQRNRP